MQAKQTTMQVPQQKEVAGVWYRNQEGKQFLKDCFAS